MFKVNERCVCNGVISRLIIKEETGTIIKIGTCDKYLVRFDERFSGRLHGEDNRCWWVDSKEICREDEQWQYTYEVNTDIFNKIIG